MHFMLVFYLRYTHVHVCILTNVFLSISYSSAGSTQKSAAYHNLHSSCLSVCSQPKNKGRLERPLLEVPYIMLLSTLNDRIENEPYNHEQLNKDFGNASSEESNDGRKADLDRFRGILMNDKLGYQHG